MSGIAGVVRFDGGPVEPELVERMTGAMAHRGPDGIDHFRAGSVALGHCMMRTTPESLEERQPLANEDGSLVLVMDGRVDNWEELRAELLSEGARLRTRADAELVLRAYERWGRDCLARIDGDFALVIWDGRRREAFCARDRSGAKSFYYCRDGARLAFASEVRALLELPWVPEEIDEGTVAEYLACEFYSREATLWKGILRLVPAHALAVDAKGPHIAQYWTPDLGAPLSYRREEDYAEHYRSLLSDAVRRQSRADRRIAFEVSGGLDSSGLFAMADRLHREGELLAPDLDGYTLDFRKAPGGPAPDHNHALEKADELDYARAVGRHSGRGIREIAASPMPLSWYRAAAERTRDLPLFPHGAMNLAIWEAAVDSGSRVLLNGIGGDEWLGGSHEAYAEYLAAGRVHAFLRRIGRDRGEAGLRVALGLALRHGAVPLLPGPLQALLRQAKSIAVNGRSPAKPVSGRSWLTPHMVERLRQRERASRSQPEPLNGARGSRAWRMRMLCDASREGVFDFRDRAAAQTQIELRQPLHSRRMAEFAFSVPDDLLLRGRTNKYLHRKAMADLLPAEVLGRASKAAFGITLQWHMPELREELPRRLADGGRQWLSSGGFDERIAAAEAGSSAAMLGLWGFFSCLQAANRASFEDE